MNRDALMDAGVRLRIAQEMDKNFIVEAGVDPGFTELEEAQDRDFKVQAWQRYLIWAKESDPRRLLELKGLGFSPSELEACYIRILEYPDVQIVYEKTPKPDLTQALETLVALVEQYYPSIPKQAPDRGYDPLQAAIRGTWRSMRYYDTARDDIRIRILKYYDKSLKPTLNRWLDKNTAKEAQAVFKVWKDEQLQPALTRWREYCHGVVMSFLLPAAKVYEELKRMHSGLNFQDLLMRTRQMLQMYPEVRRYFGQKIRCLLADEFQDTDPIQAEILFYLTGSDATAQHWDQILLRPGSLFIVGDPKQSIYRFRRADIDIYNKVRDILLRQGGEGLTLTTNFRSVQGIGKHLNQVHRKKFPSEPNSYQAAYASLDTVRSDSEGALCGVKILPCEAGSNKEEVAAEDACNIAKVIQWAVAGGMKLSRTQDEIHVGRTGAAGV